jgi:UDP-N-acetylmuramate dehydrogenase
MPRTATGSSALDEVARALGALAQRNVALGARTTYRVGGTAEVFVEVRDVGELEKVSRALRAVREPVSVLVIGRGSNMLVADAGFRGVAVTLGGTFSMAQFEEPDGEKVSVTAGGAVGLQALARETAQSGVTGFEWAVGIPGTVGGAVRMNAGGHGSEMADVVISAELFDLASGSVISRNLVELDLRYRHSSVRADQIVTRTSLRLTTADLSEAQQNLAEVVRWRQANQPGGSNAGSVFTNPRGDSAGRLIDFCGLKGRRVGSASVSEKHANFIQADRHGSADDVKALIDLVRDEVASKTGVVLVPELRMIGFRGWGSPSSPHKVSTSGSDSEQVEGLFGRPESGSNPQPSTSTGDRILPDEGSGEAAQ